jgi:protein-disulfide isomerase
MKDPQPMNFNRRKALKIAATGFLAVKAAVVLGYAMPGSVVTPAHAVTVDQLMEPQALPDMVMGDSNAPVTIIEYASMTCPHCAAFHETTLPALKEKYIDTGKVKLILREFPFDPRAAAAFMLARCAPPEQYYPMVSALFQQQKTWSSAENAAVPLLQIAKLAGFTQEKFEACLKDQELLNKVRAVFKKASEEYGVESTPTFFINGEKTSGTLSIEEMSKIIDKNL